MPVVIRWAKSVPLVEIGLTDLPKSGCAMAHLAHPGTTGLDSTIIGDQNIQYFKGRCMGYYLSYKEFMVDIGENIRRFVFGKFVKNM